MANQKRSGLGRGLSELFGEQAGEVNTPSRPVKAEEIEEPKHSGTVEVLSADEDALKSAETPLNYSDTRITEEAAEAAMVRERPAKSTSIPTPPRKVAYSEEVVSESPKPYIEEDDHVTIKGVVSREKRGETEVDINLIEPNPHQPRTNFKPEDLEELSQSIKQEGLLQPILVRKLGETYQIIAGERRWQACKLAGITRVPIRVKDVEDDKALELALIENIQRSDLNPIEEAYGYKRLMEKKGLTQSEVAQVVSKGRSTIANALRLLDLPEEAQQMLYEEKITAGHARAILSVPTPEGRKRLTQKLKEEKLSVRETEALARLFAGQTANTETPKRTPTPAYFKKAARRLREQLKTNVRIKSVKGKNKIEIEFKDEEELQRLFDLIQSEK